MSTDISYIREFFNEQNKILIKIEEELKRIRNLLERINMKTNH